MDPSSSTKVCLRDRYFISLFGVGWPTFWRWLFATNRNRVGRKSDELTTARPDSLTKESRHSYRGGAVRNGVDPLKTIPYAQALRESVSTIPQQHCFRLHCVTRTWLMLLAMPERSGTPHGLLEFLRIQKIFLLRTASAVDFGIASWAWKI